MAKAGFFYSSGPRRKVKAEAASGATIAIGDLVKRDAGYIALATASDTHVYGVAESAVSSATQGDEIYVNTHPETVYQSYCSGTLTQAMIGTLVDLEGTTGAQYVNENATSIKLLQVVDAPDGVGASAKVFVKISRHESASQPPSVSSGDLDSDALLGTKVPDNAEGTPGLPIVVSKTLTATAGTYDIVATAAYKFKVLDWWVQKLDTTASNVKLNDGTNDVSADVAAGTTDHALVRGGTIDNAYEDIAAAGSLKAITSGNAAMKVNVLIVPVA